LGKLAPKANVVGNLTAMEISSLAFQMFCLFSVYLDKLIQIRMEFGTVLTNA
jgi:hypothetical protein